MTIEEAKHRLLNIERCTPIHTREDARDFEALEMAIKALEQEPKTETWSIKDVADTFKKHGLIREQEPKTGHWIPVSERLPEINDDVLISLEWGIDIGRYSDGEWCSEWINNYDDGNVYAWMPLPKPYEPQESEDKE